MDNTVPSDCGLIIDHGRAEGSRSRIAVKAPSPSEAKLAAAKAYLGQRWILHPEYRGHPEHSLDKTVWLTAPARLRRIADINRAASRDRIRNPLFLNPQE